MHKGEKMIIKSKFWYILQKHIDLRKTQNDSK